ncbi:hypothetical protein [Rhizobium sp. RU36D]|uniref:hypothetical protein n=1 Tax=Rhizobium sp. RU36D TaxID=1907415 RepID=UPI0009D8B5E6|nr:hypothetical protein [Rhizobium sp. RU36D]SMD00041.1 hypothetical protein SAMN05880593_11485 [Rhizobium sp. RU36D]
MAMAAQDILGNPQFLPIIKIYAGTMLEAYNRNPRLSSVFATQQRWLLAHASAALFYRHMRGLEPAPTLSRLFDVVAKYQLSSRNTADAFIKEMLHYGVMVQITLPTDKRARPLAGSPEALDAIRSWAMSHLATLDRLDGGNRLEIFLAEEDSMARLHPEIADRLMMDPAIRQPQKTFSLFTWLNNGGNIMDWLIAGLGELSEDGQRYPTEVKSIADLAGWLPLSRSHLARKLREAESMGSLGWDGENSKSAMWVSIGFVNEMLEAQATKLALIDDAFDSVFPERRSPGKSEESVPAEPAIPTPA